MSLVSITRLRIRSWIFYPPFLWQAFRSSRQAKAAPGCLSVSLLPDANRVFWTCTVWESGDAMRDFMRTGPHGRVMPSLRTWCDEAALVHWLQESDEPPSWSEAHRRLHAEGRRSKVAHPSPAQIEMQYPAPRSR